MGNDTGTLIKALRTACPDGVDVYFDNVGSWISDAVYPLLRFPGARGDLRHDRRIQSREGRGRTAQSPGICSSIARAWKASSC